MFAILLVITSCVVTMLLLVWLGEELNNRVVEYVAKAMKGGSKKGGFDNAEAESKGKADHDSRGD